MLEQAQAGSGSGGQHEGGPSELTVACRSRQEVSVISTMKVLSPVMRRSWAPAGGQMGRSMLMSVLGSFNMPLPSCWARRASQQAPRISYNRGRAKKAEQRRPP